MGPEEGVICHMMEKRDLENLMHARLSSKQCSRCWGFGSLPSKIIHPSEEEKGEDKYIKTCTHR